MVSHAESLRALRFLMQPEQVTELRALSVSEPTYKYPHTTSGYFNDIEKMAKAAAEVTQYAVGVYFCINPVLPDLLARANNRLRPARKGETTSNADIILRCALPIDADPIRPAGISASEEEHDAALGRIREVSNYLQSIGWPDLMICDSGNGAHALAVIDLPVDDDDLVRRVLEALAERFSDNVVHIDRSIHNAARIIRLPGTLNCKGDNIPQRPHRMARIIKLPGERIATTRELLEAVAATAPEPKRTTSTSSERSNGYSPYATATLRDELATLRAAPVSTRNNQLNRSAHSLGQLVGKGVLDREDVEQELTDAALAIGLGESEIAATMESGLEAGIKKPREIPEGAGSSSGKPQIVVNQRLRDVTNDTLAVLAEANRRPFVFLRSGRPTRIGVDENGQAGAVPLTTDAAKGVFERIADYVERRQRDDGETYFTPKHPPTSLVLDFLSLGSWPDLPPLTGITTAPTVAPDGTLELNPGYHSATRLFYHDDGLVLGDTEPTDTNVDAAKRLLIEDLLGDFPFDGTASLANALALLLLPFVRPAISGPTPLHLVDGHTPGTGKGLLADVLTVPFSPLGAPVMTAGKDDDEWRKRITARLLTGPSHILIDNVQNRLTSADLAAAITAPIWSDRLLGRTEIINVPVSCCWVATGNNVTLSDELTRRSVWIRLDAPTERPWKRTDFKHSDLRRWARENRPALVTAALTLIRAWLTKGMPRSDAVGFGDWTGAMGGLLDTVGVTGFMANADDLYDRLDTERQAWASFFEAWWDQWGGTEVGVNDLFPLASEWDKTPEGLQQSNPDEGNILAEQITGNTERARRVKLGKLLRSHVDRTYGEYRIESAGKKQRTARYRLNKRNSPPAVVDFERGGEKTRVAG